MSHDPVWRKRPPVHFVPQCHELLPLLPAAYSNVACDILHFLVDGNPDCPQHATLSVTLSVGSVTFTVQRDDAPPRDHCLYVEWPSASFRILVQESDDQASPRLIATNNVSPLLDALSDLALRTGGRTTRHPADTVRSTSHAFTQALLNVRQLSLEDPGAEWMQKEELRRLLTYVEIAIDDVKRTWSLQEHLDSGGDGEYAPLRHAQA